MPSVLLVPDLPLERWASMDKYAHRLHDWLESSDFGFQVRLAAHIRSLTRDSVGRRGATAELRGDRRKSFLRWRTQADAYIVGTEWLKHELATWLGNDKNIFVVPFGVDRAFFSESTGGGAGAGGARERWRRDWRIPEDAFVVLHVGSTVDRKNVPLVIQTLARLRQQTDAYLLQVGGRFSAEQEQLIDRLDLRRVVRSVASADETALRRAYRAADVLLLPSLYEGFGFPVLEAFASGLPVVTSGAGGLKEVAGDAALVVEGRDPGAYVEALERLDDTDEREELVQKGWARARQFTWQKTAALTAEVYK